MKHKTKNRLIKKRKGGKTKKRRMRRGGGLFSSMSFGIPGFGSAGTCPDEQYRDPKYEMGISILDKKLNLKLPKKNFILSKKDKKNITLKEFIKKYKSL
jgi:hypothetical protein